MDALEGEQFEVAFKLDLVSGLRIGELLGLTWDCVDFDNGAITVKQSLIRVKNRSRNSKNEKKTSTLLKTQQRPQAVKEKSPFPKRRLTCLQGISWPRNMRKK